jgi:L-lactate dehydrogenase complex protein LldF
MNPYNTIWRGAAAADGPEEFHIILLSNGRTDVLADEHARTTLSCIRCGACLNHCPVYRQTGGHAYGSIYSGPIGAIVTPQLQRMRHSTSLPYASSLCGACYEVCPVKIDIPEILLHLRRRVVEQGSSALSERLAMKGAAAVFASEKIYAAAQAAVRLAQLPMVKDGLFRNLPGPMSGWTKTRDLRAVPGQSFRQWWKTR